MNIKIERGCKGENILIEGAGTLTANGRYCKVSATKYEAVNKNGNTIEYVYDGTSFQWHLRDISTIEEGNPYGTAYRNPIADPNNLSFNTSWTVDLASPQAPTSKTFAGNNSNIQKNGSAKLNQKKYIDLIPSPNNLFLHFDPIFYRDLGSKYEYQGGQPVTQSDPWYLKEFRDYNISNVVPSRPLSKQWIQGGLLGTTKAQIINNTLSYIKDPNNNDLEQKRFSRRNYLSISNSQTVYGITPPVENKKPLLILSRDDNSVIYTYSSIIASTLNVFVRLQRPLAHKSQYTSGIIREKKGIFCTYGIGPNSGFLIGYRSPHHYINGDRTYKFKFEPFSFVFGIGNGFSPIYSRPCYQTLMTDFKFKFGEMYMLTVVANGSGNVLIYVNGELQSVANVPFNPLRKPSGVSSRLYSARKVQSPIGPNFVMFDGSTFPYVSSTTTMQAGLYQGNAFIFGKSNLNGYPASKGNALPPIRTTKRRKRFFNNIDLGVINTYNIALSQAQISQFYENFRYRYE